MWCLSVLAPEWGGFTNFPDFYVKCKVVPRRAGCTHFLGDNWYLNPYKRSCFVLDSRCGWSDERHGPLGWAKQVRQEATNLLRGQRFKMTRAVFGILAFPSGIWLAVQSASWNPPVTLQSSRSLVSCQVTSILGVLMRQGEVIAEFEVCFLSTWYTIFGEPTNVIINMVSASWAPS